MRYKSVKPPCLTRSNVPAGAVLILATHKVRSMQSYQLSRPDLSPGSPLCVDRLDKASLAFGLAYVYSIGPWRTRPWIKRYLFRAEEVNVPSISLGKIKARLSDSSSSILEGCAPSYMILHQ